MPWRSWPAIGVLASLYPVSVALKIQPVRAIQSE